MRTKTKIQIKKDKRNDKIVSLWSSCYEEGISQKTALAEDIADKVGVSLSTVQRVIKKQMKGESK